MSSWETSNWERQHWLICIHHNTRQLLTPQLIPSSVRTINRIITLCLSMLSFRA
jgi:hypothetical protein